jgi:serine/threonine protein kinase
MDANQASSDDLTGALLAGKYRVLRPLGQGLVGTVYLCQSLVGHAQVAVKVLHPALLRNPRTLPRFEREALNAERLDQHPNIVPIIESGEDLEHRLLLLVVEYIEGRDLEQVIAEDWPLSNQRIIDIMSQVLTALSAAHALGILHRDLKPRNILVRRLHNAATDDHVLVSDFGLARLAPVQLTGAGQSVAARQHHISPEAWVVGSAEYAPPEQVRGEELDERSDVYAAGVVLFRLLTRTLPFMGDTPLSVALKQCGALPPPPSGFAQVDSTLEVACLKALSKTRDARFQTAREMQLALEAARGREAILRTGGWRRFGSATTRDAHTLATPSTLDRSSRYEPERATRSFRQAEPVELMPRRSRHEAQAAASDGRYPSNVTRLARHDKPESAERDPRHPSSLAPSERVVPADDIVIPKRRSGMAVMSSLAVGLLAWGTIAALSHPSTRNPRRAASAAASTPPESHTPPSIPLILPSAEPAPEQTDVALPPQDTTATDSTAAPEPSPAPADSPAHTLTNANPPSPDEGSSAPQPSAADEQMPSVPTLERLAQRASLSIGSTFTRDDVKTAVLRQGIDKVAMTECYQAALIDGHTPLTPLEARLDIETNESGHIMFASLHGAVPKPLRTCIEHVARASAIPESHHVEASFTLTFALD